MDFCQKRIIKTRMRDHVDNTICNGVLFADLESRGILEKFEIKKLQAVKEEAGGDAESELFYKTLLTKSGGFYSLLEVLVKNNQTGAVQILREKMKPIRYNYSTSDSKYFGRQEELTKKISRPKNNGISSYITSIVGMGGIGKTELYKQYCYDQVEKDESVHIFWINAEQNLTESFRKIAEQMYLHNDLSKCGDLDIISLISEIYHKLSQLNYIVVFDNIDNFDILRHGQYLTQTTSVLTENSRFILTSRSNDTEMFLNDDGVYVLEKLSLKDASMENSDFLPLFLQQSLTYFQVKNKCYKYTLSDFLDDLEKRDKNILDTKEFLAYGYKATTLHTFDASLDLLKIQPEEGPLAFDFLTKFAYLNPDNISISLFVNICSEESLWKSFRLLQRFSMLHKVTSDKFSLHRVFQRVIQCKNQSAHEESTILCSILEKCLLDIQHAIYTWKYVAKHKSLVEKYYGAFFYVVRKLTPLHLFAEQGDMESFKNIVEILRKHCSNEKFLTYLNQKDGCSRTAAFFAASHGHTNILEFIHNQGGNLKIKSSICYAMMERMKYISYNPTGWTPMHIAVYNNFDDTVLYFHRSYPELALVYYQNYENSKETPLVIAAKFGKVELVKKFTNDHVYIICALVASATIKGSTEELRTYVQQLPNENLKFILNSERNHMTPLNIASWVGAPVEVFDYLCSMGADLYSSHVETIYRLTERNDNLELFQWLCKQNKNKGLDNLGMNNDWTALHESAKSNSFNILKYVIEGTHDDIPELKINIDQPDYKGDTPLYQAAHHGNLGIVKYLVAKKADINKANKWGCTPIIAAAIRGNFDVVEFLATQDTIRFQPCYHNRTTLLGMLNLHIAHAIIAHERIDLLSRIINYIETKEDSVQRNLFCGGPGNITLLHVAAFFDSPKSIEYLKSKYKLQLKVTPSMRIYDLVAAYHTTITIHGFGVPNGVTRIVSLLIRVMGWLPNHWLQVTPYSLAKLLGNDECLKLLGKDNSSPGIVEKIIFDILAPKIRQYQKKMKDYILTQNNSQLPAAEDVTDLVVKGFLGSS